MSLPRYTWDQATLLGLATANGFRALDIKPATIRKWASLDRIHAVGKAPGGAHLYPIAVVAEHAQARALVRAGVAVSHLGESGRPMPTGGSSFTFLKLSDPRRSVDT